MMFAFLITKAKEFHNSNTINIRRKEKILVDILYIKRMALHTNSNDFGKYPKNAANTLIKIKAKE